MITYTASIQLLYLHMFHVICVAYFLHNCAEKNGVFFFDVDELIARTKAVTVKKQAISRTHRLNWISIRTICYTLENLAGCCSKVCKQPGRRLRNIVNDFDILVKRDKEAINSNTVANSLLQIARLHKLAKVDQED